MSSEDAQVLNPLATRDKCHVPERKFSDSTVKTLFALSGNRCAHPTCDERLTDPKWREVNAEISHIHGLRHNSPRHECNYPSVNSFNNLMLLCPKHHKLIDRLEPDSWTVEKLVQMKHRAEQRAEPIDRWTDEHQLLKFVALLARQVEVQENASQRDLAPPHLNLVRRGNEIHLVNEGQRAAFQWSLDPRNDMSEEPRGLSFEEMNSWEHNEDAPIPAGEDRHVGEVTDEELLAAHPEVIILRWNDSTGISYNNFCNLG